MAIKIGNSPESWGVLAASDPHQIPWDRCLDEIVESGYEHVELGPYGYFPTDPAVLGAELNSRGLTLTAATVIGPLEDILARPDLEKNILRNGELAAQLGAKFLVFIDSEYTTPGLTQGETQPRLGDDAWKRLIETTHQAALLVRNKLSMDLTFHPCGDSHVEYEDQIETFLADTDSDTVSLCLDTGHHAYRGGDAVSFMRKHHERVAYLHLKSVDVDLQKKVNEENIPIDEATRMGVFAEPYLGSVDFKAFATVLEDVGFTGPAMVEQDMYRPPLDVPLPIAKRARQHFRDVGIG